MDDTTKYMKALVFLQVQQMSGQSAFGGKPELLLNRAGFNAREISEILGKSEGAVSKAIGRAKQALKTGGESE